MKRLIIFILVLLFSTPATVFADCKERACVEVYTKDNQIIIEARKGSGSAVTKRRVVPRPTPKPILKPTPKPIPKPILKPIPKPIPKPQIKRTYKPRVVARKTVVREVNLSDRLTKLVPTGGIAFQPEFEALINVPVIFWIDVPQVFQSRVTIIGEVVDVALRPGFIWSFGDGYMWPTINPGAPYPNQTITHTYSKPGTYAVVVLTTWNGSFTHNGAVRAVTGKIIKTSVATVTVVSAPTQFTK